MLMVDAYSLTTFVHSVSTVVFSIMLWTSYFASPHNGRLVLEPNYLTSRSLTIP